MASLKQLEPSARIAQLQALANDPAAAAQAATDLIECVADDNEEVRNWATEALENLSEPAAADAAKIAKLVSSPADDSAFWALKLLGRLGEEALTQESLIAAALSESRALAVRQNAAWALGKIGKLSSDTCSKLKQAASAGDARLTQLANQALSNN